MNLYDNRQEESQDPAVFCCEGFLPGDNLQLAPSGRGELNELTFAVKDNIDLKGAVTGAGNPHWAATHAAALASAPIVESLLDAGATAVGKTIMEELAFGLIGDNKHYGSPLNAANPGRFSGGSSSGSAAVVAAGAVDFSLGTDTAGSIRVPASNCGLIGFRPSHGSLDTSGIIPLAQSFDVPGWLAADFEIAQRVGNVLLSPSDSACPSSYSVFEPAFALLNPQHQILCRAALEEIPMICNGSIAVNNDWPWQLTELSEALRVLQAAEAWKEHAEWILAAPKYSIAEPIRNRFNAGRDISKEQLRKAQEVRRHVTTSMEAMLQRCGVMVIPTVTEPALPLSASQATQQAYRQRIVQVTCISSLAGLPELSLPLVKTTDFCMGISIIGKHGADRTLLKIVEAMKH